MLRKIIHIDEDKCTGCGLCVDACHEGAIAMVDGKARLVRDGVVITEGNYLGLELPGWADVRGLIDLLVFIDTPFEELASRLIDRHMSFGRDRADAAHWVRTVDAANMALVERTKERADLVLSL